MEAGELSTRPDPGESSPGQDTRDSSTQTDSRVQGHCPRLSKVNLFTLLSLWMELLPQEPHEDEDSQIRGMGLVVVQDSKVLGLHCSGAELHAGQAAIIQHGARLADCQLYFSRRPCATCLKMIINAGVSQISFWPGDPEVSMLSSTSTNHSDGPSHSLPGCVTEDAALDAIASEKLKSNSRPHICVLLQPLASGVAQFLNETSRECDFMEKVSEDEPELNTEELFNRERTRHLKDFSRHFLVATPRQHRDVLKQMGLENFCMEPYFSNLRHNMMELVEVLAAVAAGVPLRHHGFHREECSTPEQSLPPHHEGVSQEVARHCIIQARLLAYRTDPKVGVGAVIWARRPLAGCNGLGRLYLVGCGYNAYPAGSKYAEYPQMDTKQEDRQRRKYRYIVHAEQNALTFRTRDIRPGEATMLFVTKCPCDECVPLIRGAGITHIYTTDQDRDKDKGDISYLRFSSLKDVSKFTWQRSPSLCSASSRHIANGCVGKQSRQTEGEGHSNKKLCINRPHNSPSVS
ncbi:cytidine and dCMP deaminase domain-containing protein 1 isoform X2 [Paralichthys olivaceus]|uniref:cytidine and dCMP deaminase domain-containing protein 1 isoform X2 n=1 Tax=Paralichthys olivaceus TaxID=8255 RepID=UPI00097DFEE5|nr:PREDICTED: cytidine and dCMP deaminase domain-containing protein 1 isoform X2 [Paralichthys olivaceus]